MTSDLSLPALARDVLTDLSARFGLQQWMLTRMVDEHSMVLICVGDGPVSEGAMTPWAGSVEAMLAAGADGVQADVAGTPLATAGSFMPDLRSMAAVTLRNGDGVVWGTLMGLSSTPVPVDPAELELPLSLAARSLSLVLNSAADPAGPTAPSTQRVDLRKDPLTGLLNDRGWLEALTIEDERCRRYGNRGSVAVVLVQGFDGDGATDVPDDVLIRQTGEALRSWRRGADAVARISDRAYGVLMVEVWEEQSVTAMERLRETFASRRIQIRLGLSDNSSRSLVEAAEVATELAETA